MRIKETKRTGVLVEVKDGNFNKAMRTFSKKVKESGRLEDFKETQSYEKPAVRNQRKKKLARKRWERRVEGFIEEGKWHADKAY